MAIETNESRPLRPRIDRNPRPGRVGAAEYRPCRGSPSRDGAASAARSVITKDVEPYAIVDPNPARLKRHRFAPQVVEMLLEVAWWEQTEAAPLLCATDVERFIEFGSRAEDGMPARRFWRQKG